MNYYVDGVAGNIPN